MKLSLTVGLVVGGGLLLMSIAVLVLRGYITRPIHTRTPLHVEMATARPDAADLPVAVALTDRDVARRAERRAMMS